jgi:hypothetical protein
MRRPRTESAFLTDWAQAGGNAQASIAAGAQIDRGVNFNLEIQALASIDASVGKFLGAEVSGQASAMAALTAQIQAPMNLFDEIGFASDCRQSRSLQRRCRSLSSSGRRFTRTRAERSAGAGIAGRAAAGIPIGSDYRRGRVRQGGADGAGLCPACRDGHSD